MRAQTKTYTFAASDPGADTFSVISQSCGTNGVLSNAAFDSATGSGSFDCTFPDGPASSEVAVQIADSDDAPSNIANVSVAVANVAPVVGAISAPSDVSVGKPLTFSAPFTDVGTPDTHTCTANWGDGSSSAGTVSETGGAGTCSATHIYAGSGPFTVSFTVTDDDGGVGSKSLAVTVARSVVVLNPTLCGALTLSGNAQIHVQGNVTVGSNCAVNAISASGNANITAARVESVGGVKTTGNATISPAPIHISGPVTDPLASLSAPSSGLPQNQVNCSGNSVQTIQPGVYSRIQASGNCHLTMTPGVYIVAGGGFQISGNASVTGSQVTIYNAGSNFPAPGGNTASIQLSGNGSYHLSPPIAGPTSGVLIFQARDNTRGISLSGNSTGMLGTIYAPQAQLTLSGNGELQASLIVDNLRLSGNAASSLTAGSGPADGESRDPRRRTAADRCFLGLDPGRTGSDDARATGPHPRIDPDHQCEVWSLRRDTRGSGCGQPGSCRYPAEREPPRAPAAGRRTVFSGARPQRARSRWSKAGTGTREPIRLRSLSSNSIFRRSSRMSWDMPSDSNTAATRVRRCTLDWKRVSLAAISPLKTWRCWPKRMGTMIMTTIASCRRCGSCQDRLRH